MNTNQVMFHNQMINLETGEWREGSLLELIKWMQAEMYPPNVTFKDMDYPDEIWTEGGHRFIRIGEVVWELVYDWES